MGRFHGTFRKGEGGIATNYISRKQALKKLQLSLKDFRRLCILKGIYPVEPPRKKKANKNNSTNKTYYYTKDIKFLAHEPLIDKFRSFKVFINRLKKAIGKKDQDASDRLRSNQPTFKLDHIVKERYPTFIDAVRDLDDAISMCFLFSTFPKNRAVKSEIIHLCRRLTVEFLHYIMQTKSLRKVFISVKGIYYQAEIMGQLVTWMIPHNLGFSRPTDVDFKIMVTFAQFYSTMLGFVNYKLYHSINLIYPPKLAIENPSGEDMLEGEEDAVEFVAALNLSLKNSVEECSEEDAQLDEFEESEDNDQLKEQKAYQENIKKLQNLFSGCKIFLNREVPRESLVFIIRCFGGEVSFDKTVFVGATFDESDEAITHQIVDRPSLTKQYINRYYVQPQWIFDSVNAKMLLPVELYFPGEILPPHLSPFVEEKEGDYVPPEKKALLDFQKGITTGLRRTEESEDDENDTSDIEETNFKDSTIVENNKQNDVAADKKKRKTIEDSTEKKRAKMEVKEGEFERDNAAKIAQKEAAEEKRLAIMMMPKKHKHLYDKIIFGQKRKNREALKLKEKREEIEKKQRKKKRKQIVAN
ncbi:pescadillo-like isoform X2 [Uloborus diversus]|uniref:pescadillo-like isoform X2 n=1 Tax=Uloborus diversus TaxID=327109 RepID=UPI00240A2F63|nr:pescadillo-like isoform X2 [Uloborus diversus]